MTRVFPVKGIIPPLLTPTDRQDRVDEAGLRAVVRWMIGKGVHGFFVGGSAGEGPLLTPAEYRRLMEIVLDEAGDEVALLAGVMDTSTRRVIEKIELVRSIGYRYYVVTPTFYVPLTGAADQLRLFTECHAAAGDGMELVPYNIPPFTQSTLAIEVSFEPTRRGWARVCKDSSTDAAYSKALREAGKAAGMGVMNGNDLAAAATMLDGCIGGVNVSANLDPDTFLRLYAAAGRGDTAEAHRLQLRINQLIEHVIKAGDCFIAGAKYWVGKQIGRTIGDPVSPLPPLTDAQRRSIDAFT